MPAADGREHERIEVLVDDGDDLVRSVQQSRRPPRASTSAARLSAGIGPRRRDLLQPRRVRFDRDEVGLGEVAVVERLLLGPERDSHPALLVPVARLLDDDSAGRDDLGLAFDLVLDRPTERPERVEVLHLAACAELRLRRLRLTDTLASMRIEPSSIRPSDAPDATRMPRSSAA